MAGISRTRAEAVFAHKMERLQFCPFIIIEKGEIT